MAYFASHPYRTIPPIRPPPNNHPIPLSPPETNRDSFHAQVPTASLPPGAELDQWSHPTSGLPERSKIQYRKPSSLVYQHSGVPHNHDRTLSRGSRNLIVVLPPPDFPLDHGQLGNVLSTGPRHRLSQGILMPLFPTMYGQLAAIAREFNFPSTVGLCLYHHIIDNGITMTPRISDDAWQYLWGHIFESRLSSNSPQQLPISGRLEFDVDIKKARWFDAWLAGTLREETIVPVPLSIHQWHEDSRSTSAEEHLMNEDRWDSQTTRSNSRPAITRHAPRKLSLVDRLDSVALQASYKASQGVIASPRSGHIVHHLSPIPQSAVPQPSKAELHRRVNSWRASALLDPTSMARSHQPVPNETSVDGAVGPMDVYLSEGEAETQELLNLEDFSWSITSAGPPSLPLDSPTSLYRLPSVHLDRRMEESVPLTPSTATSWGPNDDSWLSDVSSITRLPSPDIGGRMIESAPLTPVTATSWGPANDRRSDISSIDSLSSSNNVYRVVEEDTMNQISGAPGHIVRPWFAVVDIPPLVESYSPWSGMSALSSSWFDVTKVATVPSTAYSPWTGVSASLSSWFDVTGMAIPPSATSYNPWSGMRDQVWPWFKSGGAEPTTSYSPWTIVPTKQAWPWFDIHVPRELRAGPTLNTGLERSTSVNPWVGIPRYGVNSAQSHNSMVISLHRSGGLKAKPRYPSLDIYPAAYPYFDIYPAHVEDIGRSSDLSSAGAYPMLDIYPAVYPHFNLYPSIAYSIIPPSGKSTPKSINLELHPLFDFYPPLYMYNSSSIYPAAPTKLSSSLSLSSSYPWLTIYSPVYPHVIPYPIASAEVTRPRDAKGEAVASIRVKLPPQYPVLDIYSAVYPWNLDTIYPPTKVKEASSLSMQLRSSYPCLIIYYPVYPHVIPYPGASAEMTKSREVIDKVTTPVRVKLLPGYPVLDIYPVVYPWNLDMIYPSTKVESTSGITVCLPSRYPWLCIYHSVYPFMEPYRSRTYESSRKRSQTLQKFGSVKINLDKYYPAFDLYHAVYPHFDLYPALPDAMPSSFQRDPRSNSINTTNDGLSVNIAGTYPYICPYPSPAYPQFGLNSHVQIWATSDGEDLTKDASLTSGSTYPFIVIYPPVYPHFNLYPMRAAEPTMRRGSSAPIATSSYPRLVVYPPIYPYFDLYPDILPRVAAPVVIAKSAVRMYHGYPVLRIYPAVYPHFDIYPVLRSVAQSFQVVPDGELQPNVALLSKQRPAKTHRQLHNDVFVKGVVWTPSGYIQDLALPDKPHEEPSRGLWRRQSSLQEVMPRLERSRSGTLANQQTSSNSWLRRQFGSPPNATPTLPIQISSSMVPTASGSSMYATSRAIIPGTQGHNLIDDHNENAGSPFTVQSRSPIHQAAQSLVLQRARAYEQSTAHPRHQS